MTIALWIIAICEVIRAIQNATQIASIKHDSTARDNAYAEFVKSLKQSDKEFVKRLLEEFKSTEEEFETFVKEGNCNFCGSQRCEADFESSAHCDKFKNWLKEKGV